MHTHENAVALREELTPRVDRYGQLVDRRLQVSGWGPSSAFRGYRAEIEYPPAPCNVMLACDLAER